MAKGLYRSATNRMIWGVCGGLAEYFDIDPVLVRVIFVVLALGSGGVGILLYIVLAIVIPPRGVLTPISPEGLQPDELERPPQESGRGAMVAGAILVALGLIFLVSNLGWFWWFDWDTLWPIVLIAIGVAIFLGRWRK